MENIHEQIRSYLSSSPTAGCLDGVGDNDSLLESGVIDSMSMVDLVTHLEKTYGIAVDEDDMTPENFDSVACIAQYVALKQNSA